MFPVIVIYLGIVLEISLVAFVVYGWDKRQAISDGRRVSERTLHLLAFMGGWPGALMGQRHFRHKTKKLSFLILFWFVVVLHVAAVGAMAYAVYGSRLADGKFAWTLRSERVRQDETDGGFREFRSRPEPEWRAADRPMRPPAYAPPRPAADPFFDRPYESAAAVDASPSWEKSPAMPVPGRGPSPNIRSKRKVAMLLGGAKG